MTGYIVTTDPVLRQLSLRQADDPQTRACRLRRLERQRGAHSPSTP